MPSRIFMVGTLTIYLLIFTAIEWLKLQDQYYSDVKHTWNFIAGSEVHKEIMDNLEGEYRKNKDMVISTTSWLVFTVSVVLLLAEELPRPGEE